MPNQFHQNLVGDDIHALPARTYADIAARDADTAFHVAANLDKKVRIESPPSYYMLFNVGPALWIETSSTTTDEFIDHADTPNSYSGQAGNVLQVNAGETAIEFGQTLRTIDSPQFQDLTLTGDLTVQGTTTTLDSTTLLIEDRNIELGVAATPTDITADGGGITLKGTTDKLIQWLNSIDAWAFNQDVAVIGSAVIGSIASAPTDVSLHLTDPTKAFLGNSGTTAQRDAIAAVEGMQYHNLDANDLEFYNGTFWQSMGAGDVVGPAGATANALARFSLATGKLIKNSVVTLSDVGHLAGITSLQINDSESQITLGTDSDLLLNHNGVNATIVNATGDLVIGNLLTTNNHVIIVNPSVTHDVIVQLGTMTNATAFIVQNNFASKLLSIHGDGRAEFDAGLIVAPSSILGTDMTLSAGDGSSGTAGDLTLKSGRSLSTSPGGAILIAAGEGGTTSGAGGNIFLVAGDAAMSGAGGQIDIQGGNGIGGGAGGDVLIDGGTGSSIGNILLQTSDGNVGIRTATPAALLHVREDHNASTDLKVENATSNTGAHTRLLVTSDAGGSAVLSAYSALFTTVGSLMADAAELRANSSMSNGLNIVAQANAPIRFYTNGTVPERMRITPDGNVIIGTSSADSKLHVHDGSAGAVDAVAFTSLTVESDGNNYLSFLNPDASRSGINFGSPVSNLNASIIFNDSATPDGLQFRTFGNALAMAIDNLGRVSIGTSSPDASSLLTLQSTVRGFRKPAMTETQRDAISSPASGLEVFNTTASAPDYFDGADWQPDAPATFQRIHVRDKADLPIPVGGHISIPANTTLYVEAAIDLGADNLEPAGDLYLEGNGANNSTITSSHASGTIDIGTVLGRVTARGVTVSNTAPTPIAIALNNPDSSLVCDLCSFFGNHEIGAFQFVNFTRVTNFNTLRFIADAPFGSCQINLSAFVHLGPITSIEVAPGVVVGTISIASETQIITVAGGVGILVENPDDIFTGNINTAAFIGPGTPVACAPVSSSFIGVPAPTVEDPIYITVDDDGNLIVMDAANDQFHRFVGTTSTVDTTIVTPTSGTQGIVWAKGNLINMQSDNGGEIVVHDGFSTTILETFAAPTAVGTGLAFDGTNLISLSGTGAGTTVSIHDGISAAILNSFLLPAVALGEVTGATFDGVNLIVVDQEDKLVKVLDGLSNVVKYTFPAPGNTGPLGNATDLTVLDDGFAITVPNAAANGGDIFLFDHTVTFDHSSRTWEFNALGGTLTESSDRGGSQFSTDSGGIGVLVATGVWTDIAAAGIFYGGFRAMEKCRLDDETNGQVVWTGVRMRGRQLSALATITRGGSNADRIYEVAVVINGNVQTDSISSNVLPDTSTFATIQTLPITRDLVAGDIVKIQIRNITDTETPVVISSKLSIN